MNAPAAIAGQLVDARNVSTHKSFRLVIDIPAENAMQALAAFGWPTQANPVPVAIARLVEAKADASQNVVSLNRERHWSDLTPAQQSGIRCNEPAFQRFLREEGESKVCDEPTAAAYVRLICGVHSRAQLTGDKAKAWAVLETRYQRWLTVPQYAP